MKNLNPLLTLIIGLSLLLVPESILKIAIRLIGIAVIVISIIGLRDNIKNNNKVEMSYNILILLLGIILFSTPTVIAGIIPFVVGLWLTLKSLFQLQVIRNTFIKDNTYYVSLLSNIFILIIGIVLLFNPFESAALVLKIIGIILIFYSVIEFLSKKDSKPKKVKVIK